MYKCFNYLVVIKVTSLRWLKSIRTMSVNTVKIVTKAEKAGKAAKAVEKKAAEDAEAATNSVPLVADIEHFFKTSTRNENDKVNKIRERILPYIHDPPSSFLDDPVYGNSWKEVRDEFKHYYQTKLPHEPYTSITSRVKAKRNNYDLIVQYYNDDKQVTTTKAEFKYNCDKIAKAPQFMSLYVNNKQYDLISEKNYHEFYYDNHLDKYIATDTGITEAKPSKADYLRLCCGENYTCHPFFKQLYDRDTIACNKKAKDAIVNESIKAYLNTYGASINVDLLAQAIREKQTDKHFALWCKGKLHYDCFHADEMSGLHYKGVKNNNTLVVDAGKGCTYTLLLRWKNHIGILGPAWQIGFKRV